MLIIVCALVVVCVYLLAIAMKRKKALAARKVPQGFAASEPVPHHAVPPQKSYLEEKIWYESELNFLHKFDERLISAVRPQDVVRCITEAAYDFLPIERTAFLSWDKNSQKFTLECLIGCGHDRDRESFTVGKDSISGFVMRNRETVVVSNLSTDNRSGWGQNEEFYLQKAFISVPLVYKDEVLGVLHVCDKKTAVPFTEREVEVVKNMVRMGVIALQNVKLFEQMSQRAVELEKAYDALKEMQDKLVQSEKLKAIGQLASGVAHEMRNPIGIIMQGVSYLEQITPADAADPRETLSMIKESAQRADKIVLSLLDYSRSAKLESHPHDVGAILENSLNLVKTDLRNIKVIREIQPDMPMVSADKNKLMQVFINLLVNAIHSMPETGTLTVRSFVKEPGAERGKVVIVEIEDTGAGISEENLKKIFEPFFTTKGSGKGTGLGLSISRNIILLHRGSIDIKSQVNKGTTVTVTLNAA